MDIKQSFYLTIFFNLFRSVIICCNLKVFD